MLLVTQTWNGDMPRSRPDMESRLRCYCHATNALLEGFGKGTQCLGSYRRPVRHRLRPFPPGLSRTHHTSHHDNPEPPSPAERFAMEIHEASETTAGFPRGAKHDSTVVLCVCAVCVGVVGVVVVVVDSCWCCCCSCHSPQLFAWKTVPTPSAGSHEGQCATKLRDWFTVQYRLARASAKLSPLPRRQNCANSKGRQPRRQMCRQVTGGQEGLETSHPRSRRVRQHAEHTNALDPPGMGAQAPSPIFQELRTIAHLPGAP